MKPAQKEEYKIGSNRYTKESVLNDSKFEQSQFTTSMLNQNDNPVENVPNEYQNINSNKILNNDDKIDELFGDNGKLLIKLSYRNKWKRWRQYAS